MPEDTRQKKSPDFFGMSGAGRLIARTPETARRYAKELYARGTRGIFRIDNGDYVADERGLAALRQRADSTR